MLIIGIVIVVTLFVIPCNCINSCSIRLIWNLSPLAQSNFLALLKYVWQRHGIPPTLSHTTWTHAVFNSSAFVVAAGGPVTHVAFSLISFIDLQICFQFDYFISWWCPPHTHRVFFLANLHTSLHGIFLFFINNFVLCLCEFVCVSSASYSSTNNGVSWPMFFVVGVVVVACYICITNACFKCICHIVVGLSIAIIERVAAFLY